MPKGLRLRKNMSQLILVENRYDLKPRAILLKANIMIVHNKPGYIVHANVKKE